MELPDPGDPFPAADRLPDRRKLDRQHNDAGQQGYREYQSVLLEMSQRDQRDHEGGDDLLEGPE
jgi:hypothetical protein